jgi:hypothetical protein
MSTARIQQPTSLISVSTSTLMLPAPCALPSSATRGLFVESVIRWPLTNLTPSESTRVSSMVLRVLREMSE